ncbi:hypothetical protein ABK040_006228 [Willaertia magna]
MNLLFSSEEQFISKLKDLGVSLEHVPDVAEKKIELEENIQSSFTKYDEVLERYGGSEGAKKLHTDYKFKLIAEAEEMFQEYIRNYKDDLYVSESSVCRKGRK